ncbi:hypothetical protein NL676_009162 [Syzygium grande]|nr:hypothetical protein NL676_009162 [Syzygium grande]
MATPPWFILIHNSENSGVTDSEETPIVCAERKRYHRVGSSRTRKSDLFRDEREGEEMDRDGVSLRLELCPRDWKIKKNLKKSDVDGHFSRLLIPKDCVRTHVLPQMGPEMVRQVESMDGMKVDVWDDDTGAKHQLVFRYWKTSKSYVLNGGWNKRFVEERGLQVGDEIGIVWIPTLTNPKFIFKLLQKADRPTSNAATWSSH